METVSRQLATSHHMRLPVFRNHEGELAGVLHLRKVLSALYAGSLDEQALLEVLDEPYFVPATTPVLAQIQYFQENKERIALVVDEYGELMGLVTLEDIIEEIIGKFTTSLPSAAPLLAWDDDGARHRRGHDAGARGEPRARPVAADRRPEDPERPDRRAPAGHPRGRRLDPRSPACRWKSFTPRAGR